MVETDGTLKNFATKASKVNYCVISFPADEQVISNKDILEGYNCKIFVIKHKYLPFIPCFKEDPFSQIITEKIFHMITLLRKLKGLDNTQN
jgi:hypothetical protein